MLTKRMNLVLTAVLMLSLFTIGGVTLALHARDFGYAVFKSYVNYVSDNGQPFAGVSARISSLNSTINRTILGKDAFEKLNLRIQLALGKQVISVGGDTMVKLKSGQLYDLLGKTDVEDDVEKMVRLRDNLEEMGIPMIYVYPHSYIYEDGLLPDGVLDYNSETADAMVGGMRDAGIFVIDSRDVYQASGLTLDQTIYRTDQHWSTLIAFDTFQATCEKLKDYGIDIDPTLYAKDNFTFTTYPKMHMGQVGERLGAELIDPDDFVLIEPAYDTLLSKKIVNGSNTEEVSGSFQDLLNLSLVDDAEKNGTSNLYSVYGNHDAENWFVNEKVSSGRIMIVKDSYGTPFVDFLSLTTHELLAVDLRKSFSTVEDYARQYQPDIVIIAHAQAMVRGANYVFIE